MPSYFFEAVYVMAKSLSPQTQPRLCETALYMHLEKKYIMSCKFYQKEPFPLLSLSNK